MVEVARGRMALDRAARLPEDLLREIAAEPGRSDGLELGSASDDSGMLQARQRWERDEVGEYCTMVSTTPTPLCVLMAE